MAREFRRNSLPLGVCVIAILILSVAFVTVAQTVRAGQGTAQGAVVEYLGDTDNGKSTSPVLDQVVQ